MKREDALIDTQLDDVLSRWHHWQMGERVSMGYAPKALVVGDFRISRQYDDSNGQLDADLENRTMRQVDHEVRELDEPWRCAIHMNARACYLGMSVYTSPRLPSDRELRVRIVDQARCMLATRLVKAGVIEC